MPDVAIRTLERDIRGLQLVLPGGRVPWIFEGGTWWNVVSVGAFNQTEIGSLDKSMDKNAQILKVVCM